MIFVKALRCLVEAPPHTLFRMLRLGLALAAASGAAAFNKDDKITVLGAFNFRQLTFTSVWVASTPDAHLSSAPNVCNPNNQCS